ncbi:unnamed protein product [Effrenium voratum]|uniref:Acyltransferase 3 domain-containing protein n=1 Tax=Effrenium voratum TaxID=2562239 RepID=A0AA36MGC8_9DINO|nr:unnamed protein product [Effrenium voratum]
MDFGDDEATWGAEDEESAPADRRLLFSGLAFAWTLATTVAMLLQATQPEKGALRLEHFNGWQFMICCVIIWHHYCDPNNFAQIAYCSVTFFVFFSGFVTQHAYADKMAGPKANLLSFYLRRVGRVLPIYYGIHFLVLIANKESPTTDFQDSVLMLCTWHGSSPSTNFPAWTVCALFWCWLFAPLPSKLILWIRQSCGASAKYPLAVWLVLVILGTLDEIWSRFVLQDEDMDLDFWFYETKHNVFIFALGMGTCEVAQRLPARGLWKWFWPLWCDATLLGTLLVTATWTATDGFISWGSTFWSGCYAPVAVWVLSSTLGHQSLLNRLISHRLLRLLGEYTMQIYLLANPIHDLLPQVDVSQLYLAIFVCSVALTDLVERPMAERLKRATDALQSTGAREEDGSLLAEGA